MANTDAMADLVVLTIKAAIGPLQERSAAQRAELDALKTECLGLRERLAALEARAAVPGPRGPAGKDGRDGRDGRDSVRLAADPADSTLLDDTQAH